MIAAALNAYATATQRQFVQDRSQTVGASEVGKCARQVFFAKNEGDEVYGRGRNADHIDGWGARVRGTVFEDAWWYPAMRETYGDRLLYAGPDQRTLVDGFLSATPDGVVVDVPADALAHLGIDDIEGDCIAVECKSIDPRSRLDEAKPEHVFQAQAQMGLLRALTNHRPSYAVISYTDASFWDLVREFVVRFDPAVYAVAQSRARQIMTATGVQDVRPEGVIAGGRECELCAFTDACGRARADLVPEGAASIDPLMAETIADLARNAKALKSAAAAKEDEARHVEHELREMLAAAGTKRLDHEGVRIVWSPVKGRPSYDMKAIREAAEAAGVDLAQFERVGDPTDRLAITVSEIPAQAG